MISIQRLFTLPPIINSLLSLTQIPLSLCIMYTLCFRSITQPVCTTATWPMRCWQIPTEKMMVLITNGERQWKMQQGSQPPSTGCTGIRTTVSSRSVPTTIALRFHHSHAYTCHNDCSHDKHPSQMTAPIQRWYVSCFCSSSNCQSRLHERRGGT